MDELTYEQALKDLAEIVTQLEKKEIKIDQLSEKVAKAKSLVDFCRKKLEQTEAEIKKIIDDDE
ncbi:MAG: exodeoxyribonuclease VII small subunit [Crocinitomicaceae bacterium]|nr:exodeoxyribonuclease VII small subunit [Crocinitomicaceae bacterium]